MRSMLKNVCVAKIPNVVGNIDTKEESSNSPSEILPLYSCVDYNSKLFLLSLLFSPGNGIGNDYFCTVKTEDNKVSYVHLPVL